MSLSINKKSLLGSIAGRILLLFGKKPKPTADDFQKLDFKTSTQRIGIRFNKRIRDVFRFRWIKKA
jgi:hypothetical protein